MWPLGWRRGTQRAQLPAADLLLWQKWWWGTHSINSATPGRGNTQYKPRVGIPSSLAAQRCLRGPSKFSLKQACGAQCGQVGAARSYATHEVTVMPSILCVSSSSCCWCLLFGKDVHVSGCTQTGCLKTAKNYQCFSKI